MNTSKFLKPAVREREKNPLPVGTVPAAASALNLEEVLSGEKWVGPCPACQKIGADKRGNHLVVWQDGRFGCICHPGEEGREHRQEMVRLAPALAGGKTNTNFISIRPDLSNAKKLFEEIQKTLWKKIKTDLAGGVDAIGEGGVIPTSWRGQFDLWRRLWQPEDLAWAGSLYDKDDDFKRHCFHPSDDVESAKIWNLIRMEKLDLTMGVSFKNREDGRVNWNRNAFRFTVLEHDSESLAGQIALIRYAREILGWDLLMVVASGNKSIHGLFDASPLPRMRRQHFEILVGFGADKNALSRCATRIPGAVRASGKNPGAVQSILWVKKGI